MRLNVISTGIQASLEKCPLLIREVMVLLGNKAGNAKPNKGNQPDEHTWFFFDLYFIETYDYLTFLGVSETFSVVDTTATSILVNGVVPGRSSSSPRC